MRSSLPTMLVLVLAAIGCGATARGGATTTPHPPAAADPGAPAVDASDDTPPAVRRPRPVQVLDPMRVKMMSDPDAAEVDFEVVDPLGLLELGNAAMAEERYDVAIGRYRQLLDEFPGSSVEIPARYNLGLAYERSGRTDAAIAEYRRVLAAQPGGADSIDAHIRIGAALAGAGRFADAVVALEQLVARRDLTKKDQVEGWARLGAARLELGDLPGAEAALRRALDEYQVLARYGDNDGYDDYFAGMSYFHRARVAHRQFLDQPIRTGAADRARDLDAKSALMRRADDLYAHAMEIGHPLWSTAAVHQIGRTYEQMWQSLAAMPVPAGYDAAEARAYREELRKQSRQLLELALRMYTRAIDLARAYKVENRWSALSRERLAAVGQLLALDASDQLGVDRIPPPGADLPPEEPGAATAEASAAAYVPARIDL